VKLGFGEPLKDRLATRSSPLKTTTKVYFVWFFVALLPRNAVVIHRLVLMHNRPLAPMEWAATDIAMGPHPALMEWGALDTVMGPHPALMEWVALDTVTGPHPAPMEWVALDTVTGPHPAPMKWVATDTASKSQPE